jgi:proline dehydrogenase
MLRSFLIYLSKADWAQRLVTSRRFAWRAASRFVAGNDVQDAIQAAAGLEAKGIHASLNHLGEFIGSADEALKATEAILELLDQVEASGSHANVSIKLTQIGLGLDEDLCTQNLERILSRARQDHNFVRLDMEDSPYTDKTIRQYRRMRSKGFENLGLVLQAYLYRTEKDLRELVSEGARLRLVKGTYKEPPNLAFPKKADVDANYDRLAQIMIDGALAAGAPRLSADGRIPPLPAIASHDERRLASARSYAAKVDLPPDALEFQMIYGIRRDLQEKYRGEGFPLRVYIPYGIQWYPYFMRRLAERPANLWFFLSNLFRK